MAACERPKRADQTKHPSGSVESVDTLISTTPDSDTADGHRMQNLHSGTKVTKYSKQLQMERSILMEHHTQRDERAEILVYFQDTSQEMDTGAESSRARISVAEGLVSRILTGLVD